LALSVANVAIFFLDWRLKSASNDFFDAYISLCKFIDNHCVPCTVTKINKLLTIDFRKWRVYFPYPIRHLNFQKIVKKCL
jgi:hypothetical protein